MILVASDLRVMNFDTPIFAEMSIIMAMSVSREQAVQQPVTSPILCILDFSALQATGVQIIEISVHNPETSVWFCNV